MAAVPTRLKKAYLLLFTSDMVDAVCTISVCMLCCVVFVGNVLFCCCMCLIGCVSRQYHCSFGWIRPNSKSDEDQTQTTTQQHNETTNTHIERWGGRDGLKE